MRVKTQLKARKSDFDKLLTGRDWSQTSQGVHRPLAVMENHPAVPPATSDQSYPQSPAPQTLGLQDSATSPSYVAYVTHGY